MKTRSRFLARGLLAAVALSASAGAASSTASCAAGLTGDETESWSGEPGIDASDALAPDVNPTPPPAKGFPDKPVVDPSLPPDVPGLFGADVPGGAGPCLVEPPIDAMFPSNWTPPLFAWNSAPGQNVFELRVHVDTQVNDLVVYTDKTVYTMPADMWDALALSSAGHDMTVTVRGAKLSGGMLVNGPSLGTTGDVHIAPVAAPGSIVYWTTSGGTALKGFTIGESNLTTVIEPSTFNDGSNCLGCHTSSPDGKLAFMSTRGSHPYGVSGRLLDGTGGPALPSEVSANAAALLMRPIQVMPAFSPAHYSPNDAVVLTMLSDGSTGNKYEIVWTDLHAQSGGTGILARIGDARQAGTPAFSHDGTRVAYTSSSDIVDGRPASSPTDIYLVPYNDKQGGVVLPVAGASDPNVHEYYPAFSPGDGLIAFNRAPLGVDCYNQPLSEIYLVSSNGGGLTRIAANDPAACSGVTSPGVTNSWPRWAPASSDIGDTRYYWLVFSSTRGGFLPQLFISAVVTSTAGGMESIKKTYPAVYATTQIFYEANHTPAWDVFELNPPK